MNRIGGPRETDLRAVVNAIRYMPATDRQWWQLPKEYPPYSAVQEYFYRWSYDGTRVRINHRLGMQARKRAGREASPTAGRIDTQSVKITESGGPRGYDAGKKVNDRKRHIIADTEGQFVVHPAGIQDCDAAVGVITSIRRLSPWVRHLFVDGGYAGDKLGDALAELGRGAIEMIKRSDTATGFTILLRRWVVERTSPWLGRCRRLAKDFEATIASTVACVYVARMRLDTSNNRRFGMI
jgi:putative transposase